MSVYWKQSLWIGGIYWLISLIFWNWGTEVASLIDAIFSLFLVVFLIPMNWLKPIKSVDVWMKKFPIVSTMLVSVGWVPYFVGFVFLLGTVVSTLLMIVFDNNQYELIEVFKVIILLGKIRQLMLYLTVFAAVVSVVVYKRSIVGCLDKNYRLTDNDACETKTLEAAAVDSAKKMYACKKEAKERAVAENKKSEVSVEIKKKKSVKKVAVKKVAKKTIAKKEAVKKDVEPIKEKTVVKKKTVKKKVSGTKKETTKK